MNDESVADLRSTAVDSPGALIRQAREKAGIHLAVLAAHLKVSIKQLEALEADQFERLAGTVFVRGLAAKVCRFIKLDPAPVLLLLPAITNGLKPVTMVDGGDFAGLRLDDQHRQAWFRHLRLANWLIGAVSVCAAAAAWFYVQGPLEFNFNAAAHNPVIPSMPPAGSAPPEVLEVVDHAPKAMVFEGPPSAPARLPSPKPQETK
jgi:cytoskeleton protein RodZ